MPLESIIHFIVVYDYLYIANIMTRTYITAFHIMGFEWQQVFSSLHYASPYFDRS